MVGRRVMWAMRGGEREVVLGGGGGGARRAAIASSSGCLSGTGGFGGCWPRARTGGDASVSLPLGYEWSLRNGPSPLPLRSTGFAKVWSSSSSASRAFSGRTSAVPLDVHTRPAPAAYLPVHAILVCSISKQMNAHRNLASLLVKRPPKTKLSAKPTA
ncbi:unnamed protein product [Leptosia nina]|uniref:Uncharacterized protein n=1 Tax=Leptosia nina TaxID=320188 RepID=A0AAV1K0U3_9NEOP